MKKLSIVLLLLIGSFGSFAQEDALQTKKVWSLEECIAHARKNSIAIRRAILNRENNNSAYSQSIASLFPSVNGTASHSYNIGRNRNPTTNTLQDARSQSNEFGINANLNVFSGLSTQNTIRQNRAFNEASIADIQQAEYNITLNVTLAYLDIVFNDELLKAAKLQMANSTEQVERTEKLVKAGALAESNFLEVKAQQATEELNVVNAENAVELSKLNLLQLLLVEADTDFEILVPEVNDIEQIPLGITSSEIYKTSIATQPQIRSAALNIKGARYGEYAARGNLFPSLSLFAGAGSSYFKVLSELPPNADNIPFSTQFHDNFGQRVGVQLSVPIFNNYQVKRQIQVATITRKRFELNEIEARNNLRQDVEKAYTNAKTASKRLNASTNQVTALREAYRVNEQKFNVGAINSLDFTLSKNNLNRAESDFIRAKFDYIFRLKILDFYQNKPLTFSKQ